MCVYVCVCVYISSLPIYLLKDINKAIYLKGTHSED